MKARLLAAAPLAAALLLYVAGTLPLKARTREAADRFRDARRERQEAQARLVPLLQREAALRDASVVFAEAPGPGAVAAVRRAVLATMAGAPVRGVHLSVRPARSPAAATVRVAAVGRYEDVVRLAADLVRPGTGMVLERAQLSPRGGALVLDVQALALGSRR